MARFVDLSVNGPLGAIKTVEMGCDAWMRRPWWLPVPLEIRMVHRLGVAFVHEIRIGRGRLSYPIGLDAFVDGRGGHPEEAAGACRDLHVLTDTVTDDPAHVAGRVRHDRMRRSIGSGDAYFS